MDDFRKAVMSHLRALSTLALAATSVCTYAQGSPQVADEQAVQDPSDIIVTAQRRSERLVDVPASVVVVTGDNIRASGITRFQDLGQIVPSVQIARSGTYTQPAIRGVTTTFAGQGQEANVAIYVDGLYVSDQLAINQDLANIQDVQVLKGPQGTLYGRNATGGAILITTRTPADSLEANASVSYAPHFDDRKVDGYLSGPLAPGLSFGIAGYYRKTDGYIKDINDFAPKAPIRFTDIARRGSSHAAPFENYSIRPKLLIEPSANLRVTLGYVHAFVNDPRSLAFQAVSDVFSSAPSYEGYPTTTLRDRTSQNFQPVSETRTDEVDASVELNLGKAGTLTSRSSYRKQRDFQMYDLDATPLDPVDNPFGTSYSGVVHEHRRTFTQQLDYAAKLSDSIDLLAGLFYYRDRFHAPRTIQDLGLAGNPTVDDRRLNTRSWAAYVDGTVRLGDKLYATVGGRYSVDRKSGSGVRTDSSGAIVASESSSTFYPGDGVARLKDSAFTPRAVLRYNLTPGSNVYASVSRGFKAGTINNAAPFNILKPEKVTAYEVGYKSAGSALRGEFAAFYYDYKNNQVSSLDASGGLSTVIRNSGGARIYGADGLVTYRVSERLDVRASLAYLHARYRNFDNAANVVIGPYGFNTAVVGSWSGRRIARAPDWSGSVGVDYTVDVARGSLVLTGTATVSSRYAPQDSSYQCQPTLAGAVFTCPPGFDAKHAPGRLEENGYALANVQASWTDPSRHWTVTLFSDNVTNTRYKLSSQGLFYATLQLLNEPRTIGGRIAYKY